MEKKEFLQQAETLEKDTRTLDREAFESAVAQLKALQKDGKENFVTSCVMTKICVVLETMFNGNPPLKLLDDIAAYYRRIETQLKTRVIVDLLKQAGLRSVTTESGDAVSIKETLTASLVDEEKFSAWAEANGCADILKYKFSIRKGENIQAVREKLNEAGVNYVQGLDKQGLAQSLGKLARDLLDDGKPLPPDDALSVYIVEEAKLK